MNNEEASKVLRLCEKFCKDNDNNRINEWSSTMFTRIIQGELNKIVQSDIEKELDIQKKADELKKTIKELEVLDNKEEQPEKKSPLLLKKKVESKISEDTQADVIDTVEKTKEPSRKEQCRK